MMDYSAVVDLRNRIFDAYQEGKVTWQAYSTLNDYLGDVHRRLTQAEHDLAEAERQFNEVLEYEYSRQLENNI